MQYFKDFIVGDLAEAFSGYAFSAKDLVDRGIPVLKIGNIKRKNVSKTVDTYYNGEIVGKLEKYILQQNDFLIAMTGAGSVGRVGKMHDNNTTYLVNQRVAIVRPTKADANFLYYWFSMPFVEKHLYSLGIGAGQPNISAKDILKLKIKIPNRNIQTKIADILSTYDNLIENNNKRIKLLEQMAENLYKEWFVRFRFSEYENAEFENGVPKGWSNSKANTKIPKTFKYGELQELGIFTRGKNLTASQTIDGNIPVISAGVEPLGYHNKANVSGISLTISSSGANAGYLKYNLEDIWAADCSYYQNDENIWFVYNTLKYLQPVIKNMQCGAAQPHVYPKHINRLCILVPTEELIKNYNDICNTIYNEIRNINKQINNLTQQRDLFLPRLMSGKLEVE